MVHQEAICVCDARFRDHYRSGVVYEQMSVGGHNHMSTLPILQFGAPELRQRARAVNSFNKQLRSLIDAMAETLDTRDDGAALAATQVGVLRMLTVVDYEDEYLELVNPKVVHAEGEQTDYEGCLSFPGYVGLVTRFETVEVSFFTRNGRERTIVRSGRMARCLQHEIDHLNGILFVDRVQEAQLINKTDNARLDLAYVKALADGSISGERL